MNRRQALALIGPGSLALLFGPARLLRGNTYAVERPIMNQPAHIAHFTADNPGMMTLQGTNQYIVGKDSAVVIDVALSSDGNMDGIIEQAEAMGAKKIEKILLTHIHVDHCGGGPGLEKRDSAPPGLYPSRAGDFCGGGF